MDAAERLSAIEEIKKLKARYFRLMDTKDWDGFADVFTPDAVMDVSGEMGDQQTAGTGIINGARQIAASVRSFVDDVLTVHHGYMPEIEVSSSSTARGVWAMDDLLRWPEGAPIRAMHGYGYYHETYEKLGTEWRIKTLTLTRLRVDAEMA